MYRRVNQPYHTGQIVRANFPALNSLKWLIAMRYKKKKRGTLQVNLCMTLVEDGQPVLSPLHMHVFGLDRYRLAYIQKQAEAMCIHECEGLNLLTPHILHRGADWICDELKRLKHRQPHKPPKTLISSSDSKRKMQFSSSDCNRSRVCKTKYRWS